MVAISMYSRGTTSRQVREDEQVSFAVTRVSFAVSQVSFALSQVSFALSQVSFAL
jgi:hypothetical protein